MKELFIMRVFTNSNINYLSSNCYLGSGFTGTKVVAV
jgi:hypothetical protein